MKPDRGSSHGGVQFILFCFVGVWAHGNAATQAAARDAGQGGVAEQPLIVHPDVLGTCSRDAVVDDRLALAQFEGTAIVGIVEGVDAAALSDCVWRGRVEGVPGGWFILVVNDGVVMGEMNVPPSQGGQRPPCFPPSQGGQRPPCFPPSQGGTKGGRLRSATSLGHFHVRHTPDGHTVVRRIDASARLTCAIVPDHAVVSAPEDAVSRTAAVALSGAGSVIDVMVVYTPSSRVTLGGTAAVEALIDSYFVFTNAAYADSGVTQTVRLVHAQEIAYTESGSSNVDLERLRATNDGFMDEVHPLRDAWGADLVSLINTSGSAGVAFVMQNLSVGFASSAFSAIGAETGPIPGGLVFAHETAHNMGCSHNHFPGAPPGVFCYSFGYRTPDEQWRTIMSSSPGTFVNFFSNPDVEVEGQPLGVSGDGCPPDGADNVRSLNEAAATVAMFRPTVVPCGADADCDGDIDLFDFERFVQCVAGPDGGVSAECAAFDLDADVDVDFADFGILQRAFTGPG